MNIRHWLLGVAAALVTAPSLAQVGVSIHIGDPDYYGRIDIGGYPSPRLIYAEPLIIERVRYRDPVYLRVPPGHAKNWGKHCARYDACARPVYFIDDGWYASEYAPRYRERHPGRHDRHDRHDHDHDGHPGKGHGKGKGKDKHDH